MTTARLVASASKNAINWSEIKDKLTSLNQIGGIMSLFGGGSAKKAAEMQFQNQMALQQQAQQWSEYMYKNRYQMQRADLEKAGINPLYGLGSAPSVALGGGSAGMPDMVGEKQAKQQAILQGIQLGQEFTSRRVQNKNIEQQTKTEVFNTQLRGLEAIGQQIKNLYGQKELDWYDKKMITDLKEAGSRISSNLAIAGQAIASTEKTNVEKGITGRRLKWIEDHPVLSGLAIGGQELEPILNQGGGLAKEILNVLKPSINRKIQTGRRKK